MSGSDFTINCVHCSAVVVLRGKAMTIAVTCPSCKKYFRVSQGDEIITFNQKVVPLIPIGSKAVIDGAKYEVMGFVVKKENKYKYQWREYLLFNPAMGYAFLSEYDGHWNFIWPIEENPISNLSTKVSYKGEIYDLYSRYSAEVVYTEGEFFFDVVQITSSTHNRDFISPPYLLGLESSDDSSTAFMGEYVTRDEISSWFSIPLSKLPPSTGIGYTQPMKVSLRQDHLIMLTVFFVAVALVIQIVLSSYSSEQKVWQLRFEPVSGGDQKFVSSPSFRLDKYSQSLFFDLYCQVDNDWFVADFSLINEDDGTEYNFAKEIAYYSGYEGGESWTEGSRSASAYLSKIPAGNYHVNLYPEYGSRQYPFSMTIESDVPAWSNFFWFIVALLLFPAVYIIYQRWFDARRWRDSEYNPYE